MRRILPLLVLTAALTAACKDGTSPQPPANVTRSDGDNQSATVGTQLPDPLEVRVTDASGEPVRGVAVAWAVTSGNGDIATTSTTNSQGEAQAVWILGETAGNQTAAATVEGLQPVSFTATATAAAPAAISIIGGDDQEGATGAALPNPLTVEVVDEFGNPTTGTTVTWSVASGGGSVNPATSATDAAGEASTTWTLGSTPGEQTVTASVTGLSSVQFTATAAASSCPVPVAHPVGTMVNGALESGDCQLPDGTYIDFYITTLASPTSFRVTQSSDEIDSFLWAFDSDGNPVAINDDLSDTSLDASLQMIFGAGTYLIAANSFDVEAGPYTLQSEAVDVQAEGCGHTFVTKGISTAQEITAEDCEFEGYYSDELIIWMTAGETYTITMTSDEVDAFLVVLDLSGNELASNDDSGDDTTNSQVVYTATESTFVFIQARTLDAGETGAYTISIQ